MASPLTFTTPLGRSALIVTGFSGQDAISRLFSYQLDLVGLSSRAVPFDKLVGAPVTLSSAIPGGGTRYVNGFVSRFSAGKRGNTFTRYRAEVVPWLWFLTRSAGSRIFQDVSVPDILEHVLGDNDLEFRLHAHVREAGLLRAVSGERLRLREPPDGGGRHLLLLPTQRSRTHDGDRRPPGVVRAADPDGDLLAVGTLPGRTPRPCSTGPRRRSSGPGQVTLRDHNFQVPGSPLEGVKVTPASVKVGQVVHDLTLAGNTEMELYDYPGGYAKRFDGIGSGGEDDSGQLAKIQPEALRVADIRMRQEVVPAILIEGMANCRQFNAGQVFSLTGHPDANGKYLMTSVQHECHVSGDPRSATQDSVEYHNEFQCIPLALTYRPPRLTPVPVVHGSQTAVVVGPAGEEIFTDKYGRIKVQFHWDREGANNEHSSCWIRVGGAHAGLEHGFVPVPLVGWEVVVDFLEGDPDQPIVVGSVYNTQRPPPPGEGGS